MPVLVAQCAQRLNLRRRPHVVGAPRKAAPQGEVRYPFRVPDRVGERRRPRPKSSPPGEAPPAQAGYPPPHGPPPPPPRRPPPAPPPRPLPLELDMAVSKHRHMDQRHAVLPERPVGDAYPVARLRVLDARLHQAPSRTAKSRCGPPTPLSAGSPRSPKSTPAAVRGTG